MAKICLMEKCRKKPGMCMHEKMMLMAVIAALLLAAIKFLTIF